MIMNDFNRMDSTQSNSFGTIWILRLNSQILAVWERNL